MIEAAYDRITAAIKYGRGSRLIAVLVPPEIPLIPATEVLCSELLNRDIEARTVRVKRHADLLETINTAHSEPCEVVIVYGLEALSQATRESFLRASSFARTRLQRVPLAIIAVLGTETWSWLAMELPDLARWVDGPFSMSAEDEIETIRMPQIRHEPDPLARARVLLDEYRNIDLDGPINTWMSRGGQLILGGPRGVGLTHLAERVAARLAELGKRVAQTEHMAGVPGVAQLGSERTVFFAELEDWVGMQDADVVIVDRSFSAGASGILRFMETTGLVLGSTRDALTPKRKTGQIYVPPVQVIMSNGDRQERGIDAMVQAIQLDLCQMYDYDFESMLPRELISTLAFASGGLPGLLWILISRTVLLSLRLGHDTVTFELIRTVILDAARQLIGSIPEQEVDRAIQSNVLDFELEARGAVLFYVIDGQLRTLRHPLLILASRFEAEERKR